MVSVGTELEKRVERLPSLSSNHVYQRHSYSNTSLLFSGDQFRTLWIEDCVLVQINDDWNCYCRKTGHRSVPGAELLLIDELCVFWMCAAASNSTVPVYWWVSRSKCDGYWYLQRLKTRASGLFCGYEKNFLMVRLQEGVKATLITAPMLHQSGPAGRTLRGPRPQPEDHSFTSWVAGSANC